MIERLLAADAALERGELDAAARLFEQVVSADPRNAIAVVGMARIAMRRDDPEGARELAHRALSIDPQEAAAQRLLSELDARLPLPPASLTAEATPDPVASLDAAATRDAVSPRIERSWWQRLLRRFLPRS